MADVTAGASKSGESDGAVTDVDVVVVGAGFAGIYSLHHLRELGFTRPRDRGRRRRRRHLVLEPVPGCALRRAEPRVLVRLLEGAPAGVGVDRDLPGAGGDRGVLQPRRRPVRPAARHPVRHARRPPRPSTKPSARWLVETDARRSGTRAQFCVMATGCLSAPHDARGRRGATRSRAASSRPACGPARASTSPATASG